jgi:hypothetical protein
MPISKHGGPVRRWVEERPESSIDAELGEVFRSLGDEPPLSDAALLRVRRRLGAASVGRVPLLLRLLPVGVAALVGGGGAALAQWAQPGIWDTRSWFATHTPTKVAPAAGGRALPRVAAADGLPPAIEMAPEAPPVVSALPRAPVPSVPSPSGIELESELLQRALELLRRHHDGSRALALLDEHRARFPAGLLTLEASVARVDALLLLGRRAEALQQLSSLSLERVGRRTELLLLRAELNAERDCRRALTDFDAVLAATAPAPLLERALFGRANCRLRLGDGAGGRADLDNYLDRFPRGRFAAQIREGASSKGSF